MLLLSSSIQSHSYQARIEYSLPLPKVRFRTGRFSISVTPLNSTFNLSCVVVFESAIYVWNFCKYKPSVTILSIGGGEVRISYSLQVPEETAYEKFHQGIFYTLCAIATPLSYYRLTTEWNCGLAVLFHILVKPAVLNSNLSACTTLLVVPKNYSQW